MDVTVKDVCGRCAKSTEKAVDAEQMMELLKEEREKKTARDELIAAIREQDTTLTPDIVVLVKGTDGYMVETLDNLCTAPEDAKRRTGCYARVMTLIEEIFLKKKSSKKAPPKEKESKKVPPKEKESKKGAKK